MNGDLIGAAESGSAQDVASLLASGAEIDRRDGRGRTALMAATHAKRAETVEMLLDAGANVDLQDDRKDNVFLYAGAEGLLEILRLAVNAGASTKIFNRFGGSALIPAAERGHVEMVREILETTEVDVNHVNKLGWTALLEAIILSDGGPKHQEIVRILLDHGADIGIADKDGVSPLEHARSRNYAEIERMIVEAS